MISESVLSAVKAFLPEENIHMDEPMSRHTTFRIGGPASCLLEVSTKEQLQKVLSCLEKENQTYFVLGNGSNLLVSDKGYDGIVIKLGGEFTHIAVEGNQIRCGGGVTMAMAAKKALDNGLSGLEFASGIPGTVGGGMIMNAGAYGSDMSRVTKLVTVCNRAGEISDWTNEQMGFGYRTSAIKNKDCLVTDVLFELEAGEKDRIKGYMEELAAKRREKQPLEFPSAGSTFKRPEGYFAGELIMNAGLRGFQIGGAQVSEKHCGFVINAGGATAEDVWQLIQVVQKKVFEQYGVSLEPEVIFLGDFS